MTTITHLNKVSTIDSNLVDEIAKEANYLTASSLLQNAITGCPEENKFELVHKIMLAKQREIKRHHHTILDFIFIAIPYYQTKRQEIWDENKGWIDYLISIGISKQTFYRWEYVYNNKNFIEEKGLRDLSINNIVKRMDAELKNGIPSTFVSIKKAEYEQEVNNNYMKIKNINEAREALAQRDEVIFNQAQSIIEKDKIIASLRLAQYVTSNPPSPRLVETQTEYKVNLPSN